MITHYSLPTTFTNTYVMDALDIHVIPLTPSTLYISSSSHPNTPYTP